VADAWPITQTASRCFERVAWGQAMKSWENDLLDHLVFLVIQNADSPPPEDEVRDEIKRELRSHRLIPPVGSRFLKREEPVRPPG
jgi:hypothetical protein